jgi:hypothetical protein
MTRLENTTIIHAPLQVVFKYASDWQKWEDWFEGVSNFKPRSGILTGNGARYAYKVKMMGFYTAVEIEIHNFVPNAGWDGQATEGMPHQTHWIFAAQGDETKVTYILEYELPLPLVTSWLDALFIKPRWMKILNKSFENLSRHFQ